MMAKKAGVKKAAAPTAKPATWLAWFEQEWPNPGCDRWRQAKAYLAKNRRKSNDALWDDASEQLQSEVYAHCGEDEPSDEFCNVIDYLESAQNELSSSKEGKAVYKQIETLITQLQDVPKPRPRLTRRANGNIDVSFPS
jgi:hypothetical protein